MSNDNVKENEEASQVVKSDEVSHLDTEQTEGDLVEELTLVESDEISRETLEELNLQHGQFDAKLKEIDLNPIEKIDYKETVSSALDIMQKNKYSSVLIMDEEELLGILTEKDFIVHLGTDLIECLDKPITDFMTKNPFTLSTNDTVKTAIEVLTRKNFRHIPLVDENNKAIHLLSITDILKYISKAFEDSLIDFGHITNWKKDGVFIPTEKFLIHEHESPDELIRKNMFIAPLRKVMNREAVVTDISTPLVEIINLMNAKKQGVAVLTRFETEIEGIITQKDILFKVLGMHDIQNEEVYVEDFMTKNPHCILEQHVMAHAINNMTQYKYRNLVVVNKEGYPLSVITLMDILNYIADFLRHTNDMTET